MYECLIRFIQKRTHDFAIDNVLTAVKQEKAKVRKNNINTELFHKIKNSEKLNINSELKSLVFLDNPALIICNIYINHVLLNEHKRLAERLSLRLSSS